MTNRERVNAILHYQPYDRMPIVHFGYWRETLEKWAEEGHLSQAEARYWGDGNEVDKIIAEKLGFDMGWSSSVGIGAGLRPGFPREVVRELGSGLRHVRNSDGVVELEKEGVASIQQEIEHLLVDRTSWEEHYRPRLQYDPARVPQEKILRLREVWERGERPENPCGISVGSLFGVIRNWLGVVGTSYLLADDEELYTEIIDTVGGLAYKTLEETLKRSLPGMFDYAHYWEDICFRSGPLVIPAVFEEKVGQHYKRMTDLLRAYGTDIVSLDCDGCIDALLPIWLKNGVNTMFPIEVGVWDASIAPWRAQYGPELRGVGGMNKTVFSRDFDAVDAEIARMKELVKLGGFIPCPDHRIAPDAKWENVLYYTRRMREGM